MQCMIQKVHEKYLRENELKEKKKHQPCQFFLSIILRIYFPNWKICVFERKHLTLELTVKSATSTSNVLEPIIVM